MIKKPLKVGRIIFTSGAREVLDMDDVQIALTKHQNHNWGNVSEEDKKVNDEAVKGEGEGEDAERVLSSYESKGTKYWIITEWDRSATTILLPSEY